MGMAMMLKTPEDASSLNHLPDLATHNAPRHVPNLAGPPTTLLFLATFAATYLVMPATNMMMS
jgi:hypothetical protein